MTFSDLDLCAPVQQAVQRAGYTVPTPIQQQAIPVVLEGRDIFGCAQTGTGKTAAFALPILTKLYNSNQRVKRPRVVVLAPTRELATQIGDSFRTYSSGTKVRSLTVYGGVSINPQIQTLRRGVDVLIATPGRLIDLIEQREAHLDNVRTLVLDEADRMLDMGFLPQIKQVLKHVPGKRQTLFFSATMPKEIQHLADNILHEPVNIAVAAVAATADRVSQRMFPVPKPNKRKLLMHLLKTEVNDRVLVFTRTKRGADKLTRDITRAGIGVAALHGNKSQAARQTALTGFKNGKNRVLVATDIAARGIDITQLPFVINFDMPDSPETYVHRIGRTGRAGFEGEALTFYTPDESNEVRLIERTISQQIPRVDEHPFLRVVAEEPADPVVAMVVAEEEAKDRRKAKDTGSARQNDFRRPSGKSASKKPSRSRSRNGKPRRRAQK